MLYGSSITGYKVERSTNQIDWMTQRSRPTTKSPPIGLPMPQHTWTRGWPLGPCTTTGSARRPRAAPGTRSSGMRLIRLSALTTSAAPSLNIPTGLVAIARGSSQIDLYWLTPGDPEGAPVTGYRIEYSTDSASNWMDANGPTRCLRHDHVVPHGSDGGDRVHVPGVGDQFGGDGQSLRGRQRDDHCEAQLSPGCR